AMRRHGRDDIDEVDAHIADHLCRVGKPLRDAIPLGGLARLFSVNIAHCGNLDAGDPLPRVHVIGREIAAPDDGDFKWIRHLAPLVEIVDRFAVLQPVDYRSTKTAPVRPALIPAGSPNERRRQPEASETFRRPPRPKRAFPSDPAETR